MKTLAIALCTLSLVLTNGCASESSATDIDVTESELGSALQASRVLATRLLVSYDSFAAPTADKIIRRISVRIEALAIATVGSSFASSPTSVRIESTESDGSRILSSTVLLDSSSAFVRATATGFVVQAGSATFELRGKKLTVKGIPVPSSFRLDPKVDAFVNTESSAEGALALSFANVNQSERTSYSGTKKHAGGVELGLHCWKSRKNEDETCRVNLEGNIVGRVGGNLLIEKVLEGPDAQELFRALPQSSSSTRTARGKDGALLECGKVNTSYRCVGRATAL
jgi:hypothetical protein